jgi:hypothetical protein
LSQWAPFDRSLTEISATVKARATATPITNDVTTSTRGAPGFSTTVAVIVDVDIDVDTAPLVTVAVVVVEVMVVTGLEATKIPQVANPMPEA